MSAGVPKLKAQQEFFTREDVIKYTPERKGERFAMVVPRFPTAFSIA